MTNWMWRPVGFVLAAFCLAQAAGGCNNVTDSSDPVEAELRIVNGTADTLWVRAIADNSGRPSELLGSLGVVGQRFLPAEQQTVRLLLQEDNLGKVSGDIEVRAVRAPSKNTIKVGDVELVADTQDNSGCTPGKKTVAPEPKTFTISTAP